MSEAKSILEAHAHERRFSGRKTFDTLHPILERDFPVLASIRGRLGVSTYRYVLTGLLRNVFFIELVNDEISSTKMETRWTVKEAAGKKQERFDESDPRFCSFDECRAILSKLLDELNEDISEDANPNLLTLYENYSLLSYELPLDYSRTIDASLDHIHRSDNVEWIWDEQYQRTIKLREFLLDPHRDPTYYESFSSLLGDKIQVKAYLTDRVQTGVHKTNREKRWEVHPESVHFALRRTCMAIELELVNQICHFQNFPEEFFRTLRNNGFVVDGTVFRCPVTLDPLSFAELDQEVRHPLHGKSSFHVGHLTPLKTRGQHIPGNVSWFSVNGNRIQGNLSIEETRRLLGRMFRNYRVLGIDLET